MTAAAPSIVRLDLVTVEQYMHAGVVACDPSTPLANVARMLANERIHCVVVAGIESTMRGSRLSWGVLTDRDLIRALDNGDTSTTAGHIAATEVVTIDSAERLDRAVQVMSEHEVSHLVVVEKDFPVGVLSSLDIARAASDR
jgi:CBS domain-containing protein